MLRKPIVVGIIFLFILSSTIPMVVGFDTPDEDSNGLMDSAWPMKCYDTRHTGRSPYSTEDNHGVEKWRFKTGGWVQGGAVIDDDGIIYFGDFNYYLNALYPNGTLKWRYRTGGWIWSTPAIAKDGTVYVTSYDGYLHSVYSNGTLKWKLNTGDSSSSPVISRDGVIYIGTLGNKIYAIYPNGTEKWHYNTGYKIVSDPAIGEDGTVYIGSGDTYLYALYPNGTLRWRFKTGDWIQGHPSIADDGTVYIGSFDDFLYALYPNGTMKWKCKIGTGTETNPSIANDGTIYVGGNYLYAIYPNGTKKWSFNLGSNRHIDQSSPAISSNGTIYVGTNIGETGGGDIIAVNPDGTERWRKKIANDWVDSSPCIGKNGTVYIGSSSEDGGGYSYGYLHTFVTGNNNPPDNPTISGPIIGKTGKKYNYTFVTTDPDGDDIYITINWGNELDNWLGPFPSGEEVIINHSWDGPYIYTIQVKAKDTYYDYESDWTTMEVIMPKTKAISSPFIQFLENHPRLFPFIRQLLQL